MPPAIAIPCWDRPQSLQVLLGSLTRARYEGHEGNVPLVFSLDRSECPAVAELAQAFSWPHGPKEIIAHETRLGLRDNLLQCGDLAARFGSVIVLEDDSVVAPGFYQFASAATRFYADEANVAQISLYGYEYSEHALERFHPLQTDFDVYLMQWASSRGQAWTAAQWTAFRRWYDANAARDPESFDPPPVCQQWSPSSWKRFFQAYLTVRAKYVVYPYTGYATNSGAAGVNCRQNGFALPWVQAPLTFASGRHCRFPAFAECWVRYDRYFQPERSMLETLQPALRQHPCAADLAAAKPRRHWGSDYLLSPRAGSASVRTFGNFLFPPELNVHFEIPGEELSLCPVTPGPGRLTMLQWSRLSLWTTRILTCGEMLRIALLRLLVRCWAMIPRGRPVDRNAR